MYPPYKFGPDPRHLCSYPAFVQVTQRMRLKSVVIIKCFIYDVVMYHISSVNELPALTLHN